MTENQGATIKKFKDIITEVTETQKNSAESVHHEVVSDFLETSDGKDLHNEIKEILDKKLIDSSE